jgi:hypothetical protein
MPCEELRELLELSAQRTSARRLLIEGGFQLLQAKDIV